MVFVPKSVHRIILSSTEAEERLLIIRDCLNILFCYHQQELITRLTQKTSRSIVFILILNEGLMQLLKEASQREFQVRAFTPLLME